MTETTWNYTLLDFSPLFLYSSTPGGGSRQVANLDPGWNQTCPIEPTGPLNNFLCDGSSVHTTTLPGATLSLSFHGQAVQFFGNATGGLQINVNVDGSVTKGEPSGQLLASISGLAQGDHTVSLTVTSSGSLSFTGAQVTVGTGMTGADVERNVVQDRDLSLMYGAGWDVIRFDDWNIPHTSNNATWHQLSYTETSSASISFSGTAILAYGVSWSFAPTNYRMTVDAQQPVLYASSSALQQSLPGRVYTNGLLYASTNLTGGSHILTFDNDHGSNQIGLDYVEIITVNGGSPIATTSTSKTASSHSAGSTGASMQSNQPLATSHTTRSVSVGVIVGPIVGIIAILVAVGVLLYRNRRRNRRLKNVEGASIAPFLEDGLAPSISTRTKGSSSAPPMATMGAPSLTLPFTASPETSVHTGRSGKWQGYEAENTSTASGSVPGEVDRLSRNGPSSPTEIQAIRRDLQQLMQLVGRPREVDDDRAPPEYAG